MHQFQYRVCSMQNSRITFVNGEWQGHVAPTADDPNEALQSCPAVWDYLRRAGADGWELVSAMDQTQSTEGVPLQMLFLKQELA
jgi:hypothetical protein